MRYITSVTVTLIATVGMNLLNLTNCRTDTALSRKLRYALFPGASTMGLYLAVAIPLEDSRYDLSVSWNFEANYHLPSNYTELALPFVVSTAARSGKHVTRRHTYQAIQDRLNSYGLDGRECLLKTICETADTSLNHNGVIGDVLHIIFTPSSSADENLHPEFSEAELQGGTGRQCQLSYPNCPFGLYDVITMLDD